MDSLNFEFLRASYRELSDIGGFAEKYIWTDAPSACVKLRTMAEKMVLAFYHHYKIPRPFQATLVEMLNEDVFKSSVPPVVREKLHILRTIGNKAAHGSEFKSASITPINALREAFDLAKWFAISLGLGSNIRELKFREPKSLDDTKGKLQREKKAVLEKLAVAESQLQELFLRLEEERAKTSYAEKTLEEQKQIRSKSDKAANALAFDEEKTRKILIDQMILEAGWNISPDGKNTEQVAQEFEVKHQPTSSGIGRADYVLFDDNGKPLAVIEAKKTARDADEGRHQAKYYADGLEKEYGQRPGIYYTNGYDLYLWDDVKGETPRRLYAYYSKESLQRLHWKNKARLILNTLGPKEEIVDRMYQIEAIKRVTEQFEMKRRKALLVQATGTGKTRVAIALSELLIRAHWVKRILFLCDRKELRKQADKAFSAYMGSEPRVYLTARTSQNMDESIFLATYPAMTKAMMKYDPGFFDLIIADESHRSIYNRYRGIFQYFDALQVGLTATPVNLVSRNTFRIFDCEDKDPTSNYDYTQAIEHTPPYLCPFRVIKHTTQFLRQGIKYADMTPGQREQLEEQMGEEDAELVDYNRIAVSKSVFNADTDRKILKNLMENGLCLSDGSLGKTIVFARNHEHAKQLEKLFGEMYPQYMQPRQEFCAVIDNYEVRAEQLIDDFKGEGNNPNLTIAISVDMLDTGIDVPELINLVFAKPVKSYVKFWQMIGRGTRLCPNLFSPKNDKKYFQIFDHWGNFEYFGENPPTYEPGTRQSLLEQLFETRIELAQKGKENQDLECFDMALGLIIKDIRSLPEDTIAVREKWRYKKQYENENELNKWDATTLNILRHELAPLMRWRPTMGNEEAYRFDLTVAGFQVAILSGSAEIENYWNEFQQKVAQLPVNLSQVRDKYELIKEIKGQRLWSIIGNCTNLEENYSKDIPEKNSFKILDFLRRELRGLMVLREKLKMPNLPALKIDVTDTDEERQEVKVPLDGLELAAYRKRVEEVLVTLFDESPALIKIKQGQPVTQDEIKQLIEKVLLRDPNLNVEDLLIHYPNKFQRLDIAIRQIIGLDAEKVNEHFSAFVRKYPNLKSYQIRFLELVKKHIATFGALEIEQLYESPFTQLASEGPDGVFQDDAQIDDLLELIQQINELAPGGQAN
ncbi:DEAD/DEAH box helicase family protein [Fibrobacterota bacterium]